jgi:hypothetical protein
MTWEGALDLAEQEYLLAHDYPLADSTSVMVDYDYGMQHVQHDDEEPWLPSRRQLLLSDLPRQELVEL